VRFLVGITGASGVVYGVRLVERLLDEGREVDVIVSAAARRVLAVELDRPGDPRTWLRGRSGRSPAFHDDADLAALPASGSSTADAMLVVPCSMGTAARIAAGISGTLIERAADVILKERRPLVLVPRETPLSTLHLRNLLELSKLGARIVPAMPAFYFGPKDTEDLLEFVVDRALQAAGAGLPLRHPWTGVPDGEP
jgi:4-hydroxy-3-polyprenylbenzoate decarboxylase